jgi:hypothetical protein
MEETCTRTPPEALFCELLGGTFEALKGKD